jgi:transposase
MRHFTGRRLALVYARRGESKTTRITLSLATRAQIERLACSSRSQPARWARIVLDHADGLSQSSIARRLGVHRDSVRRTLIRFRERGLAGLEHGNTGRPKNVVFGASIRAEILRRASISPTELGEPFAAWSLYKLRNHLMERKVVCSISVERLRQLLRDGSYSREHWPKPGRCIGPLSAEQRQALIDLTRHPEVGRAQRARAVLALADGRSISAVAGALQVRKNTIRRWLDQWRLTGVAEVASSDRGRLRARA